MLVCLDTLSKSGLEAPLESKHAAHNTAALTVLSLQKVPPLTLRTAGEAGINNGWRGGALTLLWCGAHATTASATAAGGVVAPFASKHHGQAHAQGAEPVYSTSRVLATLVGPTHEQKWYGVWARWAGGSSETTSWVVAAMADPSERVLDL